MRALVLSGGSSKGAYHVGAINHLLGNLQVEYDLLFGISVGAINSAFLSLFKIGEEVTASEELTRQWLSVDNNKIYKPWKVFGKLASLWKPSIFDSTPLQNWLKKDISRDRIIDSGRRILVGAVSLTSGNYKLFDKTHPNFVDAIIASSSYPGLFLPTEIDGELYSDGGLKTQVPISEAIASGADEIDVIVCYPEKNRSPMKNKINSINVLGRALNLMSDEIAKDDLLELQNKNIKINIIRPHNILTDNLLNFDPSDIKRMIKIGYEDAMEQFKG
jgi:NTE family protein